MRDPCAAVQARNHQLIHAIGVIEGHEHREAARRAARDVHRRQPSAAQQLLEDLAQQARENGRGRLSDVLGELWLAWDLTGRRFGRVHGAPRRMH